MQSDVRSWGKLTLSFQIRRPYRSRLSSRMRRATALACSSLMFRNVATTVSSLPSGAEVRLSLIHWKVAAQLLVRDLLGTDAQKVR